MIGKGNKVKFNYTLRIDGQNASAKPEEIEYTHGESKIIPKLEEGLEGMNVGDQKTIKISKAEGQIPYDPNKVQQVPKDRFNNEAEMEIGRRVELKDSQLGQVLVATVIEHRDDNVVLDFNHPLAGKDVEFDVSVTGIEPPQSEPAS